MNRAVSLPRRKTPVHQPVKEVFNRSAIVFVTVCTDKREQILSRVNAHDLIVRSWLCAVDWAVGRYVVMPDHIHLFCTWGKQTYALIEKWVRYWKMLVSRQWPWIEEQPIWQWSFWDTQLRCNQSYQDKWEYVRMNPVRAGLCDTPEQWAFQGELNGLEWHD